MRENQQVVWTEGMLLLPQHFQQQARYISDQINQLAQTSQHYHWGISLLTFDDSALKRGDVKILAASGRFEDGMLFNVTDDLPTTPVLSLPPNTANELIYLTILKDSVDRYQFSDSEQLSRYQQIAYKVPNVSMSQTESKSEQILIATPSLRLTLESDLNETVERIPVAKISEVRADRTVVLDHDFIPPCLYIHSNRAIKSQLQTVLNRVNQRRETLSQSLRTLEKFNTLRYLPLMQSLNKLHLLSSHYLVSPHISPLELYQFYLQVIADLSVYSEVSLIAPDILPYQHRALSDVLGDCVEKILYQLDTVLEENVTNIPFQRYNNGMFGAKIPSTVDRDSDHFIVALRTDGPVDQLTGQIKNYIKFADGSEITDLVSQHLPGIEMKQLITPPPGIRYQRNCLYVEFQQTGTHWEALKNTETLVMYAGSSIPGLTPELWIVAAPKEA